MLAIIFNVHSPFWHTVFPKGSCNFDDPSGFKSDACRVCKSQGGFTANVKLHFYSLRSVVQNSARKLFSTLFQKKHGKRGSQKKSVTFQEPSTPPDLSSHILVNHADMDVEKYDMALDMLPDQEFEIKVINVSK